MRFTYLIQGKAASVVKYLHLNDENSRLCGLTYDTPVESFDYLPNSTYARGRNHLYEKALNTTERSDYYVFIDDDVAFSRGSFEQMERNLERHRPSIGIPVTPKMQTDTRGVLYRNRLYPFVSKQRFFLNDEQYLAIDRAVMEEGKIFPCTEEYESRSWWVASMIQQALIQRYYHATSWQFNDCELWNDQHELYPREPDAARSMFREYMRRHYPDDALLTRQYRLLLDLDRRHGAFGRNFLRFVRDNVRTLEVFRRMTGA